MEALAKATDLSRRGARRARREAFARAPRRRPRAHPGWPTVGDDPRPGARLAGDRPAGRDRPGASLAVAHPPPRRRDRLVQRLAEEDRATGGGRPPAGAVALGLGFGQRIVGH